MTFSAGAASETSSSVPRVTQPVNLDLESEPRNCESRGWKQRGTKGSQGDIRPAAGAKSTDACPACEEGGRVSESV